MNEPEKKFLSWQAAVLLPFLAGFIGMTASLALRGNVQAAPTQKVHDGAGATVLTPAEPSRLIIPEIGINASVQSVGLAWQGNGDMGIPTNFTDVAWYNRGPVPGAKGTAVIDGHLDGRNVPRAVFYRLDELKPGDPVYVKERNGKVVQFVVTGSKRYAYNADTAPIFTTSGQGSYLNLITCAGDWLPSEKSYNERVVVFTKQVS